MRPSRQFYREYRSDSGIVACETPQNGRSHSPNTNSKNDAKNGKDDS